MKSAEIILIRCPKLKDASVYALVCVSMGDGHTGECHLIIPVCPFFSEDRLRWLSCIIHLKRYPDILEFCCAGNLRYLMWFLLLLTSRVSDAFFKNISLFLLYGTQTILLFTS